MGKTVTVFSPPIGDIQLNAALLNQILGPGNGSGIVDTPISTVGNATLPAAALVGGQIGRTGPVAAYTDTTDTASNIVAALGGFQLGQTFTFLIKNATAFVQTLAGGTGITFVGNVINPPMGAKRFFGTIAGTAAAPTVLFTQVSTTAIYEAASLTDPQALALTTVGAGTITAAGIVGGVTTRGGTQTAVFTDTTDTAAAIIAASSNLSIVGGAFFYRYVNNTVFPATIAGGTGVTLSGSTVVPANSWAEYLVTVTGAGAVSMVAVGQGFFPSATGTIVNNGVTPVTTVNAAVTANSNILITLKTVGGTVGAIPHVNTITPGTGFTTIGTASDTSTYNYTILG